MGGGEDRSAASGTDPCADAEFRELIRLVSGLVGPDFGGWSQCRAIRMPRQIQLTGKRELT